MSGASVPDIIKLIRSRQFSLSDEKVLQGEMAAAFDAAGISHEREFRLDARNIVDFMVGEIGIEVKIKGARLNIFRQIERYMAFDAVKRLILATNVPMGMPDLVNGKPVHVVNLGRAWL